MRSGTHGDSLFWSKTRCFACTKRQVMSGTHRDLLYRSKGRCFASKNHTWGLGPIQTSNSDTRHAVLHAENHRWGRGLIETCNCGPKVAVFNFIAREWQVYMGSSPHLCFFSSYKTVTLRPDLQVCIGPTPQLWIWTHITAWLAQE